ncbi:O-antigen ligase family protein [Adhaeribacter radiodurans]|uniref:O-antigen ligase family protein n=1 Tax=Adhaeribacter radiodurans TaxID=2745197 RepID=A0A7L7L812_9BACT|nr:O-antigen ligase family protein [Adhaeribacter radiodurans]QMU28956.1 O-antigen ligase family protein [Adhaeribacter radiodurans]
MKLILNKRELALVAFTIFCFISFQLTEIKFYNIKINELLALLCLPFLLYNIKTLNKYVIYLLLFFCFLLITTVIQNNFQTFYFDLDSLSILRKPYFISISRFLELISCLVFTVIVYKTVNYLRDNQVTLKVIINSVLLLNFYFALFLLFASLFYYLNIFSYRESTIIYDTTPYLPTYTLRLRGYYVEGGPLGLMFAFLFCLSTLVNKKEYLQKSVFILIILLAQSKAGMIAVLGWLSFRFYRKFRHTKLMKYIIFLLVLPVFLFISYKIASGYVITLKNFEQQLLDREKDETLIMGRTAAIKIAPKMVAQHPLLGIGLGNYSLVRNDPNYLNGMPPVQGWDLPGLGGLITLLIENGIIGFTLFIYLLWQIYKRYAPFSLISQDAIMIFCLICLLGIQLQFLYIWFLIGLALAAPDAIEENVTHEQE